MTENAAGFSAADYGAMAAKLVGEAMKPGPEEPVTRAEFLAVAQIYATLATVRPSLAGMVSESLLREAEVEGEGHRARANRLQNELDDIRERLGQFGHLRPDEDLGEAVERLMRRVYNEE
jgi:hypothetical protein